MRKRVFRGNEVNVMTKPQVENEAMQQAADETGSPQLADQQLDLVVGGTASVKLNEMVTKGTHIPKVKVEIG